MCWSQRTLNKTSQSRAKMDFGVQEQDKGLWNSKGLFPGCYKNGLDYYVQ